MAASSRNGQPMPYPPFNPFQVNSAVIPFCDSARQPLVGLGDDPANPGEQRCPAHYVAALDQQYSIRSGERRLD